MSDEPRWRRYLRFFGPRGVADLDDELGFHLDMRVRDYLARGMSEADARAAAAQRFGDLAGARDACATIATRRDRRMTRTQLVDALLQDMRFAGRSLNRQKVWTFVAVMTLALGVGANSAMFSVVNHLLLNPLPYPASDRIVLVGQTPLGGGYQGNVTVTVTTMGRVALAWRKLSRSFEGLEPYSFNDVTIHRPGEAARVVRSADVLPSLAAFTGQRPIAGRMFTDAEASGEASVVVLGEGFWRASFGGDTKVLGASLTVNDKPRTIVGVMPDAFRLPGASGTGMDLWMPLDLVKRDDDGFFVVGRLRPGNTRAVAAAELDSISIRDAVYGANNARFRAELKGPAEKVEFGESIVLLTVAVALVLLIACANVAHLLLARAATRQREMAIRSALGAGAMRLLRQLLTESMILSIAGCVLGLALGWAGLRLLLAARPENLSELVTVRMDESTLLVTVLVCVATGLVFGVIGAVQARRVSTHESLKAGSLATSEGRTRGRARRFLVITEMALSTTLLIGAALLLRSVSNLQHRDLGFDARNLYSIEVQLPDRYKDRAVAGAFYAELATRLGAVPGVVGVTRATSGPRGVAFGIGSLQLEGQPDPPAKVMGFIPKNDIEPNFFAVMGVRIVQGSTFTDTSAAAGQVVVNEGFASKHWPRQSAIGRKLRVVYAGKGDWKTVVGVAADALTRGRDADASEPLIYTPGDQFFQHTVLVRTTRDAKILPVLARIAAGIDPKLPAPRMLSAELDMQHSIATQRFTMFLLLIFTAVAVGLAAVGLYGVLAYTVAQRTREIGIRIALGASRAAVGRSVMLHGIALAAIGGALGVAAARWGTKLIGSMLFGVQQNDATSFAIGAIVLFAIAIVACVVPMRRALSVDPLIALKAD